MGLGWDWGDRFIAIPICIDPYQRKIPTDSRTWLDENYGVGFKEIWIHQKINEKNITDFNLLNF